MDIAETNLRSPILGYGCSLSIDLSKVYSFQRTVKSSWGHCDFLAILPMLVICITKKNRLAPAYIYAVGLIARN
jgi:hypothetical protein